MNRFFVCLILTCCLLVSGAMLPQTLRGLSAANSAGPSTSTKKSSANRSTTALPILPPDAQSPISAALGKNDPGYWVHGSTNGFIGENPRHALVTEFTKEGAEVRSHNVRWGLETRGYGYGNALHPLKAVAPRTNANRVEYPRDGVTEWYENGPLGLEQGFTLAHPLGRANGQPLTVELAIRGDLVPKLDPGGKSLEMKHEDGEAALRYTGLKARDATGRELRSWLEVLGQRLLVRVDDAEALYPVVVDPWIQQAELTAPDGGGLFSVPAVSGSTLVVGAIGSNQNKGAAFVFVQSGGSWNQQAELTASDGAYNDRFGCSVAMDGNTVLVGACNHFVGQNRGVGAAYVFVRSGGTWSQQAELTAPDGASGDNFGNSVSVSGSTAVVGAPNYWVGSNYLQGSAYVFVENGGTWSQQAELTSSDGVTHDFFGISVAISGGTIVVGAYCHPNTGNCGPGAAYVYGENGGTWSQQAELTASDGFSGNAFGTYVAVDGTTAVVGAPLRTAAYVFVDSGGTWSQQAKLTASEGGDYFGDYFGQSVALDGSTAVVGAPFHAVGSIQKQGAAYVFVESGGTWSQRAELTAADGAAGDFFGGSVAVSGSMTVVGAPLHKGGAAYVFGSSGPLYTLSADPNSLSLLGGGQGTSTIKITPYHKFSGSVSFSASGLPNGVTAAFDPNPATNTSTLTLTASETAATGTTILIVVGVSGNLTQTTWLTLTVWPVPPVTISPSSLGFGSVAVNTTSVAKTASLKNNGAATLNISSISISGDFAIYANTCGATLAAGKTCKVKVTFTPTQLGVRKGALTFNDNSPGSPQTMPLSGRGVQPATLTPTTATYTAQAVGTTSPPKTFTLTNNQSVTLTSIAISTSGDFAVSATTCGTNLAAKAKCTISVTFTPTQIGTRTGQLIVDDSANNSPQISNLKGTGT